MSDGIKAGIGQAVKDVGEAVVKPVADEVGKAIEEGVQSVVSGPKTNPPIGRQIDPVAQQKRHEDEAKRKTWAEHVINWNQQIQTSQDKVRQEEKQKLQAKKQEDQQKQEVKQYKAIEAQKKDQQITAIRREQTKTERKGGLVG